ncbi:MAG: gluconate 2-dehydrogenase subunit 3 family protein [Sphingobacteriales bacterium]|nr:MAG: gluconate 2-dehydrogenase subunit 3 family protein [Sphingobacteriales bacterium]
MDRRKSIKAIALGTVGAGILATACNPADKKEDTTAALPAANFDRTPEEAARDNKIAADKFLTEHELATITVLADIIIPKDEVSGSASEAGVPAFIAFIVKDMPHYQTPLRGGLRWLDVQMMNQYNNAFKDCTPAQQIAMVDQIAYPEKAKPAMSQGVQFFNTMRNLTATGFYTTQMGVKDLGYMGNQPNQWNGVPDDVLKQYGLAYSEKELKECISFDVQK